MKKRKLFFLLPAAIGLSACIGEEPLERGDLYEGTITTHFLTVNITEPVNSGTRDGFETFEDGLKTENEINNVRFYFFDDSGNAVRLKNRNGVLTNYLDWFAEDEEDANLSDSYSNIDIEGDFRVEKKITAHITLGSPEGDKLPESIVAVINYSGEESSSSLNLKNLNSITGCFDITSNSPYFVMSNSVYADLNTDELYEGVDVKNYLSNNKEDADKKPVVIYVERANAKVRLKIGQELMEKEGNITLSDGTVIYNTEIENNALSKGEADEDNKVYVKFLGWSLACEPVKSFLIKNIDPTWENSQVFGSSLYNWSNPAFKRSFWAINPLLSYNYENSGDYRYCDYNKAASAIKGFGTDSKINYTYTHENAAEAKDKPTAHPTQVIVAAQLVNSKGEPWEIAQWGNNFYLKEDILRNLADLANVYEVSTITEDESSDSGSSTVYQKLDEQYFKFVSAKEAGKAMNKEGRYFAYIQIDSEAVKDKKLVMEINGEVMEVSEINTKLSEDLAPAKIWTDGMTYYTFTIDHISVPVNDGTSYQYTYGVVRNHIYEATVVSLNSLGTPVFRDDEVIIPEVPDDDVNYIAARINIINWRLASKTIQLEW